MAEGFNIFVMASLVLVGASLLLSLRIMLPIGGGKRRRGAAMSLYIAGWALVTFGSAVFLLMSGGPLGLALWGTGLWIADSCWQRRRETASRELIRYLASSMEHRVPLDVAARAWGHERSDYLGDRADQLADNLEKGMPLADALRQAGWKLPVDLQVAVAIGTLTGRLKSALEEIDEGRRLRPRGLDTDRSQNALCRHRHALSDQHDGIPVREGGAHLRAARRRHGAGSDHDHRRVSRQRK